MLRPGQRNKVLLHWQQAERYSLFYRYICNERKELCYVESKQNTLAYFGAALVTKSKVLLH
jgi:hypothetical protein